MGTARTFDTSNIRRRRVGVTPNPLECTGARKVTCSRAAIQKSAAPHPECKVDSNTIKLTVKTEEHKPPRGNEKGRRPESTGKKYNHCVAMGKRIVTKRRMSMDNNITNHCPNVNKL